MKKEILDKIKQEIINNDIKTVIIGDCDTSISDSLVLLKNELNISSVHRISLNISDVSPKSNEDTFTIVSNFSEALVQVKNLINGNTLIFNIYTETNTRVKKIMNNFIFSFSKPNTFVSNDNVWLLIGIKHIDGSIKGFNIYKNV